MKFHIFDSEQDLIAAFANYIIEQAQQHTATSGQFNLVLAGGSSPKRVYELLASPEFRDQVDWGKVYFFFGDERHVPADDIRNNALMAQKALFDPLHIVDDHIFAVDTSLSPAQSAKHYLKTISDHFQHKTIQFDLILLGLGDDAHTASLFPFTSALLEKKPTVSDIFLKKDQTFRITMSAPLINQAKQIAFLVFGKSKAAAVKKVVQSLGNPEEYPAQLIDPDNGDLYWFLDRKAMSLL